MAGLTQLTKREQEARTRSEALLGELTEAHRQLQLYAEQASELATTQERNRLAREIHDSLGHYLTIINVQLESAQVLRSRDTDRADRAVGEAKRLASEALADVRRSVAALRPSALDAVSISRAIERQVADFREHSGLTVDLAIEGDEGRCSQAAGLALFRAVQEGLTNIRKHAGAAHVAIRLRFGPATTELTIADDGRGLPDGLPGGPRADGGGVGLPGLRERLSLLGGTLDVRAGSPGGTELVATIPHRG
jgi:signal transduction histidine kinase